MKVHSSCKAAGIGRGINGLFFGQGLIHSLHTLIIDRHGILAANLEGNDFTAEELGDLVQSMLKEGSSNPSGHANSQ